MRKYKQISIGDVFSYLTVVRSARRRKGRLYWRCECVCGKFKEVSDANLKRRSVRSCGCFYRYPPISVGDIFSRLTVMRHLGKRKGLRYWLCRCQCGNTTEVWGTNLSRGLTRSCGCLRDEIHTTHGHYKNRKPTREYVSWTAMLQRCFNPNANEFERYGGRGITVCERWKKSFVNFISDLGPRPPGHSLDRIDGRNGYFPGNCKWSTPKEQANNQVRQYKKQGRI